MSKPAQNFENHAKFVPVFHYVMAPLLMASVLYFGYRAATAFSVENLMFFLFSVGTFLASFIARIFPLGVQDRVIRLEERMRMERLLPDDMKARIGDFSTAQLVGLRFASDDELPDLARRVLDEGMTDRKAVKGAVKNWRADDQRI
mgnify:CR=1 FL=1|jgi:uncharacterized membrane protein YciS (DUF1049 family)